MSPDAYFSNLYAGNFAASPRVVDTLINEKSEEIKREPAGSAR